MDLRKCLNLDTLKATAESALVCFAPWVGLPGEASGGLPWPGISEPYGGAGYSTLCPPGLVRGSGFQRLYRLPASLPTRNQGGPSCTPTYWPTPTSPEAGIAEDTALSAQGSLEGPTTSHTPLDLDPGRAHSHIRREWN